MLSLDRPSKVCANFLEKDLYWLVMLLPEWADARELWALESMFRGVSIYGVLRGTETQYRMAAESYGRVVCVVIAAKMGGKWLARYAT